MGIDYETLLYLGKVFDEREEATEFIKQSGILTKTEEDELDEVGVATFLESYDHLDGEFIDSYNGYGLVVGYDLSPYVYKPEAYLAAYKVAMEEWYDLFKDIEPEIIHEVKVW